MAKKTSSPKVKNITDTKKTKKTIKTGPKKVTTKKVTTKKVTPKKTAPKKTAPKKTAPKKVVTTSKGRKRPPGTKPVVKVPIISKTSINTKVNEPEKKTKRKVVDDNRYVKVSVKAKNSRFVDIGAKVQRRELKWMYYAVENDIGYHYYLKLKNK